jgi:hypothetical protein
MSKNYDDCDNYKEEKKYYPMIIQGNYPSLTIIPKDVAAGTTFIISSFVLNTSFLNNPRIKLDFISNVFADNFNRVVSFQVFKLYKNQFNPIPVGSEWKFSVADSVAATFSFFVFDCDVCNSEYCIYTVVATVL